MTTAVHYFSSIAGPSIAGVITCDLPGTPMRLKVDPAQFTTPQDMGEPPRRGVTINALSFAIIKGRT